MPVTSFADFYTRVKELLVDGYGAARTLPAGNRFIEGAWDGQPASEWSRDAHEQRRYFARLTTINLYTQPQAGSRIVHDCVLLIQHTVFLDHPADVAASRAALAALADDQHRMRAVLTYPGNMIALGVAGAGNATGVDEALIFTSWSSGTPDWVNRVIVGTMQLKAYITLDAPS